MRHLKKRLLPLGILLLAMLWLCGKTLVGFYILLVVGIFKWIAWWGDRDHFEIQNSSEVENSEMMFDEELPEIFDQPLPYDLYVEGGFNPSTGKACTKVEHPWGVEYF